MSLKISRSLPLLFLFFTRMRSFRQHSTHVALCPHDSSIEGLVDFCSDVITLTYDFIDDVTIDQLRDEQRIVNSTCAMYRKRTSCYNRLLHHCQPDSRVSSDVRMILDRLSIYSRTCLRDAHEGIEMMRCYGRFSRQIRTCSQAHDAYYPFYVIEHQSRSACRVLNSAINCLLQIEQEMLDACANPLWSSDFHTAYIRPLVHRSHNSSYRIQCPISSHLRDIHLSPLSLSTATRPVTNLLMRLAIIIISTIAIVTAETVINE